MGRLVILVFLAHLALLIAAVADCLGGERNPRRLTRVLWVAIIVLVPIAGSITWFLGGRPRPEGDPAGGGRTPRNRPSPPSAPDDDAEFLRDLERRLREDNDDRDK